MAGTSSDLPRFPGKVRAFPFAHPGRRRALGPSWRSTLHRAQSSKRDAGQSIDMRRGKIARLIRRRSSGLAFPPCLPSGHIRCCPALSRILPHLPESTGHIPTEDGGGGPRSLMFITWAIVKNSFGGGYGMKW